MSGNAGPLEFRQRYASEIETIQTHLDGRQAQIHTALPGQIVSYNPTKMTASVQIGIQAMHEKIDGSIEAMTILPIQDVPVHFPGGGGHTLTFPVKAGDECLVIFAERNIDNWFQHGGTQQPGDYRMHDINDAFVMVGTRSQPKVPNNVSPTTVQLRSDDGHTVVQIDGANGALTLTAPNSATITCPTVTINGDLHVNGQVWAEFNSNPVSVQSHHHQGANAGNPPQVGT